MEWRGHLTGFRTASRCISNCHPILPFYLSLFLEEYELNLKSGVYSSSAPGYGYDRLDTEDGWIVMGAEVGNVWYQNDAGSQISVSGVATQGRKSANQWRKQYKVKVSLDGASWQFVDGDHTVRDGVFKGKTNRNTRVAGRFTQPVEARYVCIYPVQWKTFAALRAGLMAVPTTMTTLRTTTAGTSTAT